jgi:outer membrane biosynthesis protein TonB
VFAHEKVYTVFLDVRATTADRAPSWTLQYARLRSAAETEAGDASSSGQEGLTPPFPLTKEVPKMNSELIRTYLRNVIVVFAIIDTQGKLQHLSVRQSPNSLFNAPILAALTHWRFQPAQLNGQPVALKVLMGIPLLPYE